MVAVRRRPLIMEELAYRLACAWHYGDWTLDGLRGRTCELLGRRKLNKQLEFLVGGFWRELRGESRRQLMPLAHAIEVHPSYKRARKNCRLPSYDWSSRPKIQGERQLAEWLEVDLSELHWLADRAAIRGHYRVHWCGSRLIEAPRPRLKAAQRILLHDLLGRVPPHDASHGFRRGRSVLTAVRPHVGRDVLFVTDLRRFFTTTRATRVAALFQRLGYGDGEASLMALLCTTRSRTEAGYLHRHLPQGAPTSPAIANLCVFHLDSRLSGLASRTGATYTRYADDLIFSGPRELARTRFRAAIERIVREEGYPLNVRKTRVMTRSMRQSVLGLVVNERPTLPRAEIERLEATLLNCVRSGPAPQNRSGMDDWRGHLAGRVAWARQILGERGRHLSELFEAIDFGGQCR